MPPKAGSIGASQQKYQRDRAVRLDLSAPRTAQQLGVEPGRTAAAFNREGGPYWRYEIALPGGELFTTAGFGHFIRVDFDPAEVLINSRAVDLQAGSDALLAATPVLGLDAQDIDDWAQRARDVPLTTSNSSDVRVFDGVDQGYLTVYVEARRNVADSEVVLNWGFLWHLTPSASDTPTP